MTAQIRFPFTGSFPVTFPFGASAVDSDMQKKFDEWGIVGHNGVDYGLPEGTAVVAVDTGAVVQAGEYGDFGTTIIVKHRWGTSLYAHLSNVAVGVGQKVTKDRSIGASGHTGSALGPHLHFGIKPLEPDLDNGYVGFIDPTPFMPLHLSSPH